MTKYKHAAGQRRIGSMEATGKTKWRPGFLVSVLIMNVIVLIINQYTNANPGQVTLDSRYLQCLTDKLAQICSHGFESFVDFGILKRKMPVVSLARKAHKRAMSGCLNSDKPNALQQDSRPCSLNWPLSTISSKKSTVDLNELKRRKDEWHHWRSSVLCFVWLRHSSGSIMTWHIYSLWHSGLT